MQSDFHLHSAHSADSKSSMTSMAEQAISIGLKAMCFTEHMDYDTPAEMGDFILNTQAYFDEYKLLSRKYESQIKIYFGVELGLQVHLAEKNRVYLESYPFDFVIGSSHIVGGCDPYFKTFFEGRREEDCYRQYFESIADNIREFQDFDSYGHLDYVVRYGPNQNKEYSYLKYKDIIEEVLSLLIQKDIALEVNSGGLKYGLGEPNPCIDILKAYKKMGGKMITIGSDAHEPIHIAYEFQRIREILRECGFHEYVEFHKRVPAFVEL